LVRHDKSPVTNHQSQNMDILERIIAYKKIEVGGRKQLVTTKSLERSQYFNRPTLSLKASLLNPEKSGIIAEFKRHSPSKKDINITAKVADVTTGYTKAGVSGISCLTDTKFFKGTTEDLKIARLHNPQNHSRFKRTWVPRFSNRGKFYENG